MRHVPASGANVRPVRRTFWISVATPTVNASTRNDGSDRLTQPVPSWLLTRSATRPSTPEKSALDSDVSATSSYPVRRRPSRTIVRTCSSGRSRTGRVIIPAWQKRQPRVQPRKISTLRRSCTTSMSGTSCCFGYGQSARSATVRLSTVAGTSAKRGRTSRMDGPSYSTSYIDGTYTPGIVASSRRTASRELARTTRRSGPASTG